MNQELGTIYIATNLVNGKQNVGQTTRELKKRVLEHKNGIGSLLLYSAIKKYGIENFKWVHFDCPIEDLDWTESFLIKELNTLAPNGYNLDSGGNQQKHRHEITKQKISENNYWLGKGHLRIGQNNPNFGHKWTQEQRNNLSEIMTQITKGKNNPMYGKSHSEETKRKISKTRIEKEIGKGKNNPMWGKNRPDTSKMNRKRKGMKYKKH